MSRLFHRSSHYLREPEVDATVLVWRQKRFWCMLLRLLFLFDRLERYWLLLIRPGNLIDLPGGSQRWMFSPTFSARCVSPGSFSSNGTIRRPGSVCRLVQQR